MLSKEGEIRRDDACLDYGNGEVILYSCHGSRGNQEWSLEAWGGVRHPPSGRCLAVAETRDKLLMEPCSSDQIRQKWRFENLKSSGAAVR